MSNLSAAAAAAETAAENDDSNNSSNSSSDSNSCDESESDYNYYNNSCDLETSTADAANTKQQQQQQQWSSPASATTTATAAAACFQRVAATVAAATAYLQQLLLLLQQLLQQSFELEERNSSISDELFGGCVHFISSCYVLPVIPFQLQAAGYNRTDCIEITALASAVGCIVSSYVTNLPFVVAPVSSVTIYVAVALQRNGMNQSQGDAAVILSGFALLFVGVCKPLVRVFSLLLPDCLQASSAVGIGIITALAGATEIELVVPGQYAILSMGPITAQILIALAATVLIAVSLHFKLKGAFVTGLLFGTLVWWSSGEGLWPQQLLAVPHYDVNIDLVVDWKVLSLLLNLTFLYLLTLSGIARAMSDLAHLSSSDGSIPRGQWLFIMCGLSTIFSGYFSGPPILISPESAPAIKAGNARTGLSALCCGFLFGFAVFLRPVFEQVPPAGTSPLLILVGLTLFVNTSRVRWQRPDEAIPAFFVLLLIPFTYSILTGVGFGYALYISIGLLTGRLQEKIRRSPLLQLSQQQRTAVVLNSSNSSSSNGGAEEKRRPQLQVASLFEVSPLAAAVDDDVSNSSSSSDSDDSNRSNVAPAAATTTATAVRSRVGARPALQQQQQRPQLLLFASLRGRARSLHRVTSSVTLPNDSTLSPIHLQQQQQQQLAIANNNNNNSRRRRQQRRRRALTDQLPMDLENSISSLQFSQQ